MLSCKRGCGKVRMHNEMDSMSKPKQKKCGQTYHNKKSGREWYKYEVNYINILRLIVIVQWIIQLTYVEILP